MPPLTVMVKPVSGACNMACRYCFYRDVAAHRATENMGRMDEGTLDMLIRRAFAYADGRVSFVFQGGEPMLAGLAFYERLMALERKYNARKLPVHNAIQTNGTLIDAAWATFFREHGFLVGVSLDGTQALHDANRIDARGDGTYRRVTEAIALLRTHQVDYNILCVVTQEAASRGREVFEALRPHGYLQFIPCIDDFDTKSDHSLTARAYGAFLIETFDLYAKAWRAGRFISVRNFDNYIGILRGQPPELCGMMGVCGRYYLIEADGGAYPCDFYVLDEWRTGNIHTDNFLRLSRSPVGQRFIETSARRDKACGACRWFSLCRGGCRRDCEPFAEGVHRLNRYCEGYQAFFAAKAGDMLRLARAAHRSSPVLGAATEPPSNSSA